MEELLKDYTNLLNTVRRLEQQTLKDIEGLVDEPTKQFLTQSLQAAMANKLDLDTFIKQIDGLDIKGS